MKTTSKAEKAQTAQVVCVCVFLALAILAVFGQTARFGFVDYDDPDNVSANPVVQQGLSVKAVGWAFAHAQGFNWIPLTTLSHILDCQMFGLRAGGHHMVSVLLHAATAVLLFLVLRHITGSLWRSAFVAAVFAVHPLRAESVAWVSERKDVLSGVFFVLAIGAYARYVEKRKAESRKRKFFYVLTLVFFALGLLAKSMVATLPLVLLLLDYWPLGRMKGSQNLEFRIQNLDGGGQGIPGVPFWGLVKEKIPLFVLAAGACVATALVPGLMIQGADRIPLFERVRNAVVSYAVYLEQMVFPSGLATPYPNPPHGQPGGKVWLALVLLATITAAMMVCRKKRPYLLAGWLWYLGMAFPVIGIVQISAAAHADRYTYLPGIGLAIALTWAVADGCAGWKYRRAVLGALMIAVAGALTVCGCIQTSYWRDSQSLWTRALSCTSCNFVALNNMGTLLVKQGKLDEGIEDFKAGLAIAPGNAEARNNLGNALAAKGADDDDAIAQYQKALEIRPDYAEAHFNLGNVLIRHGRLDEAIAHYRKAVELNPDQEAAQNNLGQALLSKGDTDGGMACLEKAAAMNPDPLGRWLSLGKEFLENGKWKTAILFYRQAIRINPRVAEAWAGLGMACIKDGQPREAIDSWQKALEINPGQISVLNNLAWVLATASDPSLRNGAQAAALAAQAGQLSGGGNPVILHTLAAAYAEQGSYGPAADTARRALELAAKQKQDALAAALQQEIKLYEANKPLRNAPQP